MLNILQNMYTSVLFMDIISRPLNTVEINCPYIFPEKRDLTKTVVLGSNEPLAMGSYEPL